ncbi:MAG: hypothetical protein ACJ8AE_01345, partial [Gemmatimonadaceae bacterium]
LKPRGTSESGMYPLSFRGYAAKTGVASGEKVILDFVYPGAAPLPPQLPARANDAEDGEMRTVADGPIGTAREALSSTGASLETDSGTSISTELTLMRTMPLGPAVGELLSEQATPNARTIAPAEASLRRLKRDETAVGRRIVTLSQRVTYKTTIPPKLNRTYGPVEALNPFSQTD